MYRTLLGVSKEFVHIVKAMEQRESTAPCKDVSKEFVLIGCVLRKRSVFILYFTHPHLYNENKLRTHTSKVRYISFQRNLQLKIHLSSYHPLGGSTPHN